MVNVELSEEDAALILQDYDDAIKELEDALNDAQVLKDPPDVLGSGIDGQASRERAKQNGENYINYIKDLIKALEEQKTWALSRIHALFGADFDNADHLKQIMDRIAQQSPPTVTEYSDPRMPHTVPGATGTNPEKEVWA